MLSLLGALATLRAFPVSSLAIGPSSRSLCRPPARPSLLSAAGEHRLGLREVSARDSLGVLGSPCCRMAPGFPPSLLPLGPGVSP